MGLRGEYKGIAADTARLLAGQEGKDVDFKIKPEGIKSDDFVAFANARGGTILVGVAEEIGADGLQKGVVVGCQVRDEIRQGFISSAVSCRPSIEISVRVENVGTKKPIYRIDVAEGTEKPYCTAAGLYKMRAEGQNIGIDPTMMTAIILERESAQFVARFKRAAEDLLEQFSQVQRDLAAQVDRLER